MNDKFIVKFRGVRGSYPTAKRDFLEFGGNTASIEVICGKQLIILDAGTGIIDIGKDITKESECQSTIFLTHIHQDHIQGLQFYKPLFNPNAKISLFGLNAGKESLKDSLKAILFDKVFPLGLEEIKSEFKISDFNENKLVIIKQSGKIELFDKSENIKCETGDIKISAYKTNAHPKYGCLCIKIEYEDKILVYATDKESYGTTDEKFIDFARSCDILIHDAQYTNQDYINPIHPKRGYGHSTFEMAIKTAQLSKAKKLFFFHYDPDYNDEKLRILEEHFKGEKTFFAKENLEIKL